MGGDNVQDGNDVIMGSSGADKLYSGLGNDTMIGDFAQLKFTVDGLLSELDEYAVEQALREFLLSEAEAEVGRGNDGDNRP